MKYRPEIDGLRAIAVVPVILFHAGFDGFRGGFIGVDVFFVISGYLITSIVHHQAQNGSFSVVAFYERRARRIIPALFCMILVSVALAWRGMLPSELTKFSESIIAALFFCANIYFYNNITYFSRDVESFPLIHTWSLSVEEQFYIAFPFLAKYLVTQKRAVLFFVVISTAVSLALAEWMSTAHPTFNFYMLPTRGWELGVGMIAALAPTAQLSSRRGLAEAGSIAGLLLIAFSVVFFDSESRFPSVRALVPVIGAALIIVLGHADTLCGRLLGLEPLVRIGLVSYSAYLWHQPLFAFARLRLLPSPATHELMLALSAAALCLGYLSYRFIERPFRDRRRAPARPLAFGAGAIGVALLSFAIVVYLRQGLPGRLPPTVAALWSVTDRGPARRPECWSAADAFLDPAEACDHHAEHTRRIALWGDSHSHSIAVTLADLLSEDGVSLRQFGFAGCPPMRNIHFLAADRQLCPTYNKLVFSYIERHRELTTIILYARWPIYMHGYGYDNGEGGKMAGGLYLLALPSDKGREFEHDERRISAVGAIFRANVEALLKLGRKVVLVYPTPEIGWLVPESMMRQKLDNQTAELSVDLAFFKKRTSAFRDQLDRLPEHENLLRIHPETIFCNGPTIGRCVAEMEGEPLYSDDNHLNNRGASLLSRLIIAGMKSKGWL